MALLAIAVVSWGLHYKLTLYAPVTGVHASAPAAKLLSQRERTVQSDDSALRSPERPSALGIVLTTVLIFLIGLVGQSFLENFSLTDRYSDAVLEKTQSIRPPPLPAFLS
jgi:hypothetical protein